MLGKWFAGVLVSLVVSSNAMAIGWHCTDSNGAYWKFHADGGVFSGDINVNAPGSVFGVTGRYWNLVMNTSWAMNFAGGQYLCLTADQAMGKTYSCSPSGGVGAIIGLFNCDGGLFD